MGKYKLIFLFLLPLSLSAQFVEFGGGLGVSHYTGDLNGVPRLDQSKLAGTGIYRLNFSDIVSFKFAFTAGSISGNDRRPVDALGENRQYEFKHNFLELSGVFEYHFMSYRSEKYKNKWSPYAFFGLGFVKLNNTSTAYEDYQRVQPVLPMGGGVKYMLSKRLTLAGELGARKTFFDYLDGISDGDQSIKNYQYGNPNDKDWYFYSGISLTYVLYKIPCPFPYIPNKSILNRIRAY
ncbi:MAG: DUF6089 family protein [Marinoscillum sp.]|uniref:type IX secretion system protein PorG n=2 Tax=Marinoscillum sp. TaxID=2024838 RepID=UPI003300EE9B